MSAQIPNPNLPKNVEAFGTQLVAWFKKNGRDLPWRKTWDPYAILVSEIMLQQTQVITVIDYYDRWMKIFPDFASLAAASEAKVLHAWQGLGYYSRARNLHRTAQIIMQTYEGKFPEDLEAIRQLPGIGRYTAGAVATFAFSCSTPIIDANIMRVLARLFNVQQSIDSTIVSALLWQTAGQLVPRKQPGLYNSALMELGALICVPRAPKCVICPVKKFCTATEPEKLPIKKPRRKTVFATEKCAFTVSKGKLLLQQEVSNRWRGLWRLPDFPGSNNNLMLQLEYPITHHRVTLKIFKQHPPKKLSINQSWHEIDLIENIAMPAPHRRAMRQLQTLGAF